MLSGQIVWTLKQMVDTKHF